jgi:hypothetical protein
VKRKLGPLPLWAWILIAGGAIGIVWYLRKPQALAGDTTALPATQQIPDSGAPAPGDSGGGGAGDGTVPPTTPTPVQSLTDELGDVTNLLGGVTGFVDALPGGQGVTDQPAPVQTFAGEIADFAAGVKGINELLGALNPKAPPDKKGKPPKGRKGYQRRYVNGKWIYVKIPKPKGGKHPGSGGVGKSGGGHGGVGKPKPVRHPKTHHATGRNRRAATASRQAPAPVEHAAQHHPAPAPVKHTGQQQHHRTGKPPRRRRDH